MSRVLWITAFVVALIEIYSILPARPPRPEEVAPVPYRSGIIHVHSVFSDGGGTIPEIADSARDAGVDFVVVTDHNTAKARREGFEKSYAGVDVFVELEASVPAGHSLVFFSQTSARDLEDQAIVDLAWKHYLGQDTRPGLFLVAAHPSSIKNPWNRLDRFTEGMETLNFNSMWQRELSDNPFDFAATAMLAPLQSFLAALRFFQPYPKDFLGWDAQNAVSPGHFGLLGHDTHSHIPISRSKAVHWPSYDETFKLGSNIVFGEGPWSEDFEERRRQIYQGIRQGRVAQVFQAVYPFRGNDSRLVCGDRTYRAGDHVSLAGPCSLTVETPQGFPYRRVVRLVKDGETLAELEGDTREARFDVSAPGVYRIEVWARTRSLLRAALGNDTPYVFYNPIYVR